MPDRPILIFPTPEIAERAKQTGRGATIISPSPTRQRQRLAAKFNDISRSFERVAPRVDGLEPEQVIVFEAAGSLTDVAKAADRVPGLEWLSEWDLEDFEADDDFQIEDEPERRIPQRLFALMSNQAAMNALLALWRQWQAHPRERAKKNFGPFKNLFQTLRDVRRWSAKDRVLDTRVEEYWRERLTWHPNLIRFEVELWFRSSAERRGQGSVAVERVVTQNGGQKIDEATIEAIRYHGMLVECPAETVEAALAALRKDEEVDLLRCEDVMFFRPVAQAMLTPLEVVEAADRQFDGLPIPDGAPVVALLDGVPLVRHAALDGRVILDDPDGHSGTYRANEQVHGTGMASLIIHGDLADQGPPLTKPIYIRPVMRVEQSAGGLREEQFPADQLFLDVVHRAVRRMFVGDGDVAATAPTVRVINVSLGNPWQPFVREMSPLAKLLDWLAWEYKVLFLISAGNCGDNIELECSRGEYRQYDDRSAVSAAVRSLRGSSHNRRLISPAEALNALTVGAANADGSANGMIGDNLDLMRGRAITSPISRLGLGLLRGVKPDVLMAGGRQLYRMRPGLDDDRAEFMIVSTTRAPGHLVASAGTQAGALTATAHTRGTSNATSLSTRLAARVFDNLTDLFRNAEEAPDEQLIPVLVKAMIVHAASWVDPDGVIAELIQPIARWQERRRAQAQLMGYGVVVPERALVASDQRVVLVGAGWLLDGQAHRFSLPLPGLLSGQEWRRRLTATVGWLTPLHFRHRKYRRAKLYVSGEGVTEQFGSTAEADDKLADHGTVQHLIREIADRRVIEDDEVLRLQVNCKADAGDLEGAIPYGFAVTLEVAAPIPVNIYEPISQRLRPRVAVRPG